MPKEFKSSTAANGAGGEARPKSPDASARARRAAGAEDFVVFRTETGVTRSLPINDELQRAAMAWLYTVRNRERWTTGSNAKRAVQARSRDQLEKFGLDKEGLDHLKSCSFVEVSIPYVSEEKHWAARIMPWEVIIPYATRAAGGDTPPLVVRHLDRRRDPTERRPIKKAMVIVSEPEDVREIYDFTSERELARRRLNLGSDAVEFVEAQPTAEGVKSAAKRGPDVIHVAGVDTHEGAQIRGLPPSRERRDGLLLSDAEGHAVEVASEDLARLLNAAPAAKRPMLVVFNVYQSASRTAALTVAEGADAALGFSDTIDNLVAELFLGAFYEGFRESTGNPLIAFRVAWDTLRERGVSLGGSGIVLWSARPLLESARDARRRADTTTGTLRDGRKKAAAVAEVDLRSALVISDTDVLPLKELNYALLHNGFPMFERFTVRNTGTGPIRGVEVHAELFAGDSRLPFTSLYDVADGIDVRDRVRVPLTSELARNLKESVWSTLRVTVSVGQERFYDRTHEVKLLATNEWVDEQASWQWLPSFVYPSDPAVQEILAAAERYLKAIVDDPSAGFDGYQRVDWEADDPTRLVDAQVKAIWSAALNDFRINYVNPPPTYTKLSQRLRTPSDILKGRRGTCIDLALLLAACCEYVEIYPVVFLLEGHAFPGYWRSSESWDRFQGLSEVLDMEVDKLEDLGARDTVRLTGYPWVVSKERRGEVMRFVEEGHLVPIESVWLTNFSGFDDACDEGWENLLNPEEFHALIDIANARRRVTPLPIGGLPR